MDRLAGGLLRELFCGRKGQAVKRQASPLFVSADVRHAWLSRLQAGASRAVQGSTAATGTDELKSTVLMKLIAAALPLRAHGAKMLQSFIAALIAHAPDVCQQLFFSP